MNANEVIEKILADGKAEADKVLAKGQEQLKQINEQNASKLAEFSSETQRLMEKAAEDKKLRILASARMQSAKSILAEKRKALDSVFDAAMANILGMDQQSYLDLMTKLIKNTIETGDECIITGKNENMINDDFIKKLNRELGSGFKGNLRLEPNKANIKGGFILQRGDVSVNVSLEVLITMVRETLEAEFARDFFE